MRHILDFYAIQLKHQQIIFGFVSALMAVMFGISGANAFVGDVVGVELDGVTCTNTTKGTTAIGTTAPGGVYNCQPIPTEPGDLVEMTLSGAASAGQMDCVDVMENATTPPLIPLIEGTCFNLIGSIATGFGNLNNPTPGFEVDAFAFQATDATAVRLSLAGDEGVEYIHLISDINSNALLNCVLTTESCRGAITESLSAVGILASVPGAYVLELRVTAVNVSDEVVKQTIPPSNDLAAAVRDAVRQYIGR